MSECKDCARQGTEECSRLSDCVHSCFIPKTYTLDEIADRICASYGEVCEDTCPGFDYCHQGKNGCLTWLENLFKGDANRYHHQHGSHEAFATSEGE